MKTGSAENRTERKKTVRLTRTSRGTIAEMVRAHRLAKRMPALSYMEMILTGNCNLRCAYCWEKGKKPVDMPEETALAAVDLLLKTSQGAKTVTVLFFGGEPLLRFDLIREVWAYATKRASRLNKKISWSMTTNGTLLDEETAKWCASHKVKFLLSMDGGREDHNRYRRFPDGSGSFDVIVQKLPTMKRYQPWMGVRMSVTPESSATLAKNMRELHGLGINQFLLGYAHGIPWSLASLVAYEKALREACELYLEMRYYRKPFRMTMFEIGDVGKMKAGRAFGCGAGRGRFSVDPYGDIHGCSKLATIMGLGRGVLTLGNVFQGLTGVENRIQLLDSSANRRRRCQKCQGPSSCAGGCPAVNYSHTGNIFDPDELSCRTFLISARIDEYMKNRYREVFAREIDEGERNGR